MATVLSKEITNLYYLGGLIDNDGPQYVTAGGQAFVLPPPGESLRIEAYKAHDLIQRYNIKGSIIFSLSPTGGTHTPAAKREFTRDELLEMLAKLAPSPVEETPVTFDDEPDAHLVDTPTPEPESTPGAKGNKAPKTAK